VQSRRLLIRSEHCVAPSEADCLSFLARVPIEAFSRGFNETARIHRKAFDPASIASLTRLTVPVTASEIFAMAISVLERDPSLCKRKGRVGAVITHDLISKPANSVKQNEVRSDMEILTVISLAQRRAARRARHQ
jgi:hypothetical protein